MKKELVFLVLVLFVVSVKGQTSFTSGWLPKVVVSVKTSSTTKWVNSIEAREIFYEDEFAFSHSLVDISSIFSIKSDVNKSFNVGYILRFKEDDIIHRTVQHFNLVQSFDALKLGHRFGFEQFFESGAKPQYRTRYRASLEKALSGDKVDVKEWYVKLSNEYLWQFNEEDLEVRLSPYLGYQLSKKDKLEFGLDYRLGKLLDTPKKNSLWFRTTWYISL